MAAHPQHEIALNNYDSIYEYLIGTQLLTQNDLVRNNQKLSEHSLYELTKIHKFMIENQALFTDIGLTLRDCIVWCADNEAEFSYVISRKIVEHCIGNAININEIKTLISANVESVKSFNPLLEGIYSLGKLTGHRNLKIKKIRGVELTTLMNTMLLSENIFSTDKIMKLETKEIASEIAKYTNMRSDHLERITESYITNFLTNDNNTDIQCEFFPKTAGVQFGKIMRVSYVNNEGKPCKQRYYIKSHQHGSTSQVSSTKPIDPKELFVYKLLEYTGYGPEVHFCVNQFSVGGFYIMTKDVGFTDIPHEERVFETYDKIKDGLANYQEIDEHLAKALSRTDILSRILCLQDLTPNPTNFGRVTLRKNEQEWIDWQIVDFRVESRTQYIIPNIYEGFRQGNGMFNYNGFLYTVLKERPEQLRVETAGRIMSEFEIGKLLFDEMKMPFLAAVDNAFCDIVRYISENSAYFNINLDDVLCDLQMLDLATKTNEEILEQLGQLSFDKSGDLGRYITAIRENFINLANGVLNNINVHSKDSTSAVQTTDNAATTTTDNREPTVQQPATTTTVTKTSRTPAATSVASMESYSQMAAATTVVSSSYTGVTGVLHQDQASGGVAVHATTAIDQLTAEDVQLNHALALSRQAEPAAIVGSVTGDIGSWSCESDSDNDSEVTDNEGSRSSLDS